MAIDQVGTTARFRKSGTVLSGSIMSIGRFLLQIAIILRFRALFACAARTIDNNSIKETVAHANERSVRSSVELAMSD